MNYNTSFKLKCEVELYSGRRVILDELHQELTYGRSLEDSPSTETNNLTIDRAMKNARQKGISRSDPLLVPPLRRDFLQTPGDMEHLASFIRRPVEWLPGVQCIAKFHSLAACHDPDKDGSLLVVVWFQNEFAMPIDLDILQKIQALDCDTLATDFEY